MDWRKTLPVIFCFCLLALSLYGKDRPAVTVNAEAIYFPARAISGYPARAEIFESEAELSYELKLKGKLPFKISFRSGHTDVRQGAEIDFPSHLESQELDLETTFPFPCVSREGLYLRLGLTPSFFSDNWDCTSSAFRMPLRAAAIFRQSDQFTFIAGARLGFDLERELVPFLGMIYKPGQDWTMELIPPRPRVIFSLNKDLRLFAEAEYCAREYEVSRNTDQGLVLRKKGVNCGLGLSYYPGPDKELVLSGGRALNHYLKYADSTGKISLDDSWYLRCAFKAGF